ncbi:mediator of RNA polymerase II transcription subunit 25-like, partial [Trifolium medium]|nr:mediator of RNA polymerase II transcription subunit 25-like [Trifolium medium]
ILVQRTGWTKDPDVFLQWLSSIPFSGGGFNDAAIAEGLAEALMSFIICVCACAHFMFLKPGPVIDPVKALGH